MPSAAATILYLHGMGERVRNGRWLAALNGVLEGHGLPARETSRDVLVPDYVDLLAAGGRMPVSPAPVATYDEDRAAAARVPFMRERNRLVKALRAPARSRH